MKRIVLVVVVLMALVSWHSDSQAAPVQVRDEMVLFSYYASNANWWTGLAILNYSNNNNSMRIQVFNSTGTEVASANFNVGAYDATCRFDTKHHSNRDAPDYRVYCYRRN